MQRDLKLNKLLLALMLGVILVLIACSNDSPAPVEPSNSSPKKKEAGFGTIVALGDSLTAGYGVEEDQAYPALLQDRLLKEGYFFRVVNAGISGETSSGTRSRIAWVLRSLNPDIVILVIGANDGLRGIDTAVLEKNLEEIVAAIQAENIVVILGGMKIPPNIGRTYSEQFSGTYPRVAQKMGAPLIPFFLEGIAGDRRYNLADMIHPNPEGYRRIVDHIYPYVLETIKHVSNKR